MSTPTSIYPYDINRPRPANVPRLVMTAAPAAEVFASSDAVVQQALKLDSTLSDGTYVDLVLAAARRYFERLTGLALITQTWKATFDRTPNSGPSWPPLNEVELGRAPLVALTAVNYLDTNGAAQTDVLSNYAVGNVGSSTAFGRARLKDSASFPDLSTDPGALSFTFTCGFGADASFVPQEMKAALLMLSAHWYENRLPVITQGAKSTAMVNLPFQLQSLIEMCRVAELA